MFKSPFLIFLGTAFLLRIFSFFPSVINHDESTYIVIADALLRGQTYWVEVIDIKPVGIFLIYAALLKIGGGSIFLLRLFTAVWVAGTGYFLYRAAKAWQADENAARASGMMYIFMCSLFTFYGVSPNTELYYTLFNTLALWLILAFPQRIWGALGTGLCLGAGFMIKYTVAFDALAMGLMLIWIFWQAKAPLMRLLLQGGLMISAFLVVPLLVYWTYHSWGLEKVFLHYTFGVGGAYPAELSVGNRALFLLDFLLRFLPITLAFCWGLYWRTKPWVLACIWALCVLVAINVQGKPFGHYFIQMMLPVAWLAGTFYARDLPKPRWIAPLFRLRNGAIVLSLLFLVNLFLQKKDYLDKPDHARETANYLRPLLLPDDRIYLGNYHQIVYHLLGQESPTPYVHRSLIWEKRHRAVLQIHLSQELAKIQRINPRFVVFQPELPDEPAAKAFLYRYREIKKIRDKAVVYERRPW
ncbi:MAG: glycosyltransferase family 39 protein [Haliscomenobacter sp.]|uniref:ArnT family glycosyltransferase n=1 Tax=Haliscomenobacter sp. TaxID=2717303 RepID=UPI0029A4D70A|nr:glycosyltransferase family 39 protein [Haliscomenobacter sp.]MDX2067653.1 glycosyltransferase family 39 protein [Haliscomenobacter sp.]